MPPMPIPGFAPFTPQPIDAMPQLQSLGAAQKPLMPPPRPMGFMGRVGQFLTPDRLRAIAAGLHDLSAGSNTLPELLHQLDEQRAQLEQQRWQRIQQDQAVMGWKRQDQQRQAMDDWVSSLPPDQQADARANPEAAYSATMQANANRVTPMTPEEVRAIGLRNGSVAQRHANGDVDVLQAPREPTQGGVSIALPETAVTRLARQYLTTGTLPTGISRDRGLVRQIYLEADALAAAEGLSPQDQAVRGATFQANRQGLGALTRQRSLVQSFERTATANLELAQRLSRNVPRSDYPLLNRAIMTGQLQGGSPETAAYFNALIGARTEYAKVLSGATGATGLTDSARHEAEQMFSQYASPETLDALIATAREEMHNRLSAFDQQEQYIRQQMGGSTQQPEAGGDNHARVGGRPMTANPPASSGGVIRYDANGRRIP